MEQDDDGVLLEDGEIVDDADNFYNTLERPENYSVTQPLQRFPPNPQYSDSEEELLVTSDSDSDSDSCKLQSKRPKIKLKPKIIPRHPKRKKYDIWSTRVQEDVLAETLNSCDVTTKDRSRSVESYDYSLGAKYYAELEEKTNEGRTNNKRTRNDRKNINFKPKKRSGSNDKSKRGNKRILQELEVTGSHSPEEIAKDIANKLCEEREDLILKVIDTMGKEKTFEFFTETKRIEEEGGMLIMNQMRRRTPGGVFLFLVRNDYHITNEQKAKIFDADRQKFKQTVKERKKEKSQKLKNETAAARAKLLPDLLTRAELLASQNPTRKLRETDERDVKNPPPSPETDHHSDGMDGVSHGSDTIPPAIQETNSLEIERTRGKLETYDDDVFDIGCSYDMDLF